MPTSLRYFVVLNLLLMPFAASANAAVTLVKDASAKAVIVLPDNASGTEKFAADRFNHYMKKISGVDLKVLSESTPQTEVPNIYIGKTKAAAKVLAELKKKNAPEEASEVLVDGSNVFIVGIDDIGTLHGVYFLLEDIGCRWYFPTDWGIVVPQLKTITLKDQKSYHAPDFKIRRGLSGISTYLTKYNEKPEAWEWGRGNHLGGWRWWGCGHSYNYLINKSNFAKHPEWFALVDGKRQPTQLCTTNPEVRQETLKSLRKIIKTFKGNQPRLICISPNDNNKFCSCKNCSKLIPGRRGKKELNNSIDRIVEFANFIAGEIAEEYPEYYVTYYCNYHSAGTPKFVKPAKNTVFWLTHWAEDQFHGIKPHSRLGTGISDWGKFGNPLFIYTYWGSYGSFSFWPAVHAITKDIRYFHKNGVMGVYSETNASWGGQHLNYIVFPRLLWDVDTDVWAWVDDFCNRFYGPASKPMQKYYRLLEEAAENGPAQYQVGAQLVPTFNPRVLRKLRVQIDKAESLLKGADDIYKKRMDFVVKGFRLGELYFLAQNLIRNPGNKDRASVRAQILVMFDEIFDIVRNPEYADLMVVKTFKIEKKLGREYEAVKNGTVFGSGEFKYGDDFVRGGRVALDSVRRRGFIDGSWGLDLHPDGQGSLEYEFKATGGSFDQVRLEKLGIPSSRVAACVYVKTDRKKKWTCIAGNESADKKNVKPLKLPIDLTDLVRGKKAFRIKIRLTNISGSDACALTQLSVQGTITKEDK